MKKIFTLIFLLYACTVIARQADPEAAYIKEHYTKLEVRIPMRDGVKLFTAIYIPKDGTRKYPFLICRTPYTTSPYGKDTYKTSLGPSSSLFTHDGYIFVYQDVRGKWMSEGQYEDVRAHIGDKKSKMQVDESSDTYDTIDWLLKNVKGNNGRAGMYGISYPGFYATAALPDAHPALKAVSPQAPVTDWFIGDDIHHNGAFFLADAFGFHSIFSVPRPHPITPDRGPKNFDYKMQDAYKFFLTLGPLKNAKLKYFGDSIKFWNEAMMHGNYDAYWKSKLITPYLKNIKPATLVVGGFFDAEDCYGALETYKAIEQQNPKNRNSLVMGPWFHGGWARSTGSVFGDQSFGQETSTWYANKIEFPFFQHYLKDAPDPGLPEAWVFETGSNKWKRSAKWPPAEMELKHLFLQAGGKLSFNKPSDGDSFDEYVSDPFKPVPYQDGTRLRRTREYMIDDQRFASRRPDVMVYESEVLSKDIVLNGPLVADLQVSTSGTDADFVVKLIDVFPDDYPNPVPNPREIEMGGYQMLVRGEVMRGKFRDSFSNPKAFVPGEITRVSFKLPDVAHAFLKGHKIMVQIQSSWFPLVDRNPQKFVDIYHASEDDFQKATHRIYHDANHVSSIILPIVK